MPDFPGIPEPDDHDDGLGVISFSRPQDIINSVAQWRTRFKNLYRLRVISITYHPTLMQYVMFYEWDNDVEPYPYR